MRSPQGQREAVARLRRAILEDYSYRDRLGVDWVGRFRGRVVVLIGPGTVSSCESFALMLRRVAGCTLIGARTAGSSGNPQPVDLGNGVTVYVPSWKDLLPNGICLEGRGVTPDIVVKTDGKSFVNGDPVLEAAVRLAELSSVPVPLGQA